MSKRLEKYIREDNFYATDDELRKLCPQHIGVFYGFNTYSDSVQHIMELVKAVKEDRPDIKEKDMTVWYVQRHQSRRHAGYTTLYVPIPIEDYLRMRHNDEISIL